MSPMSRVWFKLDVLGIAPQLSTLLLLFHLSPLAASSPDHHTLHIPALCDFLLFQGMDRVAIS